MSEQTKETKINDSLNITRPLLENMFMMAVKLNRAKDDEDEIQFTMKGFKGIKTFEGLSFKFIVKRGDFERKSIARQG